VQTPVPSPVCRPQLPPQCADPSSLPSVQTSAPSPVCRPQLHPQYADPSSLPSVQTPAPSPVCRPQLPPQCSLPHAAQTSCCGINYMLWLFTVMGLVPRPAPFSAARGKSLGQRVGPPPSPPQYDRSEWLPSKTYVLQSLLVTLPVRNIASCISRRPPIF